jgi:hypothetical protein
VHLTWKNIGLKSVEAFMFPPIPTAAQVTSTLAIDECTAIMAVLRYQFMTKKVWILQPPRKVRIKPTESLKAQVKEQADHLIELVLKPAHINPVPKNMKFNYIVDLYSKWYHSYFYFCATYRCPFPDAISEFFETRFARLEYTGNQRFNLSYMRHTGQWVEIFTELTLDECLESIRNEPHYLP